MADFQFTGSTRWNDTCVADVVMDKDGNPISCCNPITGVCLGGGGGGATAKLTFIISNENATGDIEGPIIIDDPDLGNIAVTQMTVDTGTVEIEVALGEDGALIGFDVDEITSTEGAIEASDRRFLITGDATVTAVGFPQE